MRKYGLESPYEQLKEVTRGAKVEKEVLREFIKKQKLPEAEKERMLALTPKTYIGNA
jgi:adenylosuccinate lyase